LPATHDRRGCSARLSDPFSGLAARRDHSETQGGQGPCYTPDSAPTGGQRDRLRAPRPSGGRSPVPWGRGRRVSPVVRARERAAFATTSHDGASRAGRGPLASRRRPAVYGHYGGEIGLY